MEQAPNERNLIINAFRYRQPLPEAIQNAPEIGLGLDFYYVAFWDLITCRNMTNQIPWTAINEYAKTHNVTDDQLEWLFYLVPKLNAAYNNANAPKAATKTTGAKKWQPASD